MVIGTLGKDCYTPLQFLLAHPNSQRRSQIRIDFGFGSFIFGNLEWDENIAQFELINKSIQKAMRQLAALLTNQITRQLFKVILQLLDIADDDMPEENPKYLNEKDRLFWEKFQKKKKEFAKTKKGRPQFGVA